MTKQIAIIDPYVVSPAIPCFNRLVELLGLPCTYHTPSQSGLKSILEASNKTSGYIILGSASHVHEKLPWQFPLASLMVDELKNSKPVLGCCFGHQLLCHAFGAEVNFFSKSEVKISGLRKMRMSQSFGDLSIGEELNLGVTHKQVVRNLPPELLSIGEGLENDIVIHKNLPFMGTQGHPECSHTFCLTDIQNLTKDEIQLVQKDGAKLITAFFKKFGLVS
jgi:GMP synthase-like glutamine amidotransferase